MTTNIYACIERAEQHCKEHGARLTARHKNVMSGLLRSEKAMSAYELVDYCKDEFGYDMPAMSVYRIPGFLQDQLLVHKLNSTNKYIACSHTTSDHGHEVTQFLICDECQRVKEISISQSTIKALQNNIEEAGFHLVSPQLEMNCLCGPCINGE